MTSGPPRYRRRDVLRMSLFAAAATASGTLLRMPAARGIQHVLPPLGLPDANGWRLPAGFTSRVIATSGQLVAGTGHTWHTDPDGGAVFAQPDGSHIYVSNNEGPPGAGGVGAVRVGADGTILDAFDLLTGSERNCSGGAMPWGTWLSCEEREVGRVWECDPTGATPPIAHHAMGWFRHEAAIADPDHRVIYMTEDRTGGGLYRYTPDVWGDLSTGTLQILTGVAPNLTWTTIDDPSGAVTPTRLQHGDTVTFDGGEGLTYADETVFLSTKGDDKIWELTTDTLELSVLYDRAEHADPTLRGVDTLTLTPSGDLVVCEDGDDMQLVLVGRDGSVQALAQLTGTVGSELTGAAFDPTGSILYVSSQRNPGRTYAITGPFQPPALPRFESDAAEVHRDEEWFRWDHPSQSGGASEVATTPGARLSVLFDGATIRVIGQRGPGRSTGQVIVDGVAHPIVTDAAGYASQEVLFSSGAFGPGEHLLEVLHDGAPGQALVIDAIETASITALPSGPELERIENDDPDWHYLGDWSGWEHPSQSGGSVAVGRGDAVARLPFSGEHLRVVGQLGPDRAMFEIRIDGTPVQTVDTYSSTYRSKRTLADLSGLGVGEHLLELAVVGANPLASGVPALLLDAVETLRGNVVPLVRVEDDDPAWVFTGTWDSWTHPSQSGGSAAVGRFLGSDATIRFLGPSVRWIGQIGPDRAIATVLIDGVQQAVVDTYASSFRSGELLYFANGLGEGAHTLTIRHTGANPFAGLAPDAAAVIIDAVEAVAFP